MSEVAARELVISYGRHKATCYPDPEEFDHGLIEDAIALLEGACEDLLWEFDSWQDNFLEAADSLCPDEDDAIALFVGLEDAIALTKITEDDYLTQAVENALSLVVQYGLDRGDWLGTGLCIGDIGHVDIYLHDV
jgi:hypothetical protein